MNAKKTLLNPDRVKAINDVAHWLTEILVDNGFFRSCLNCSEWNKDLDLCFKFKVKPPTKVIVTGCEHHSDVIPF
jgi:hypothetical protein